MTVTEEARLPELPSARVATRPGAGGVAEQRRRIYQRHLLLFLVVGAALIAADLYTSPQIQWAYFVMVPWGLVFLLHSLGLKSRGYSFAEMLIPPRQRPVKEVYTVPLDYELVRARQLRDGVANAAGAVRHKDAALADKAVAAADGLVAAVEAVVVSLRGEGQAADKQVPSAQAAVDALDELHEGLLKVGVLEEPGDVVPIDVVNERAQALGQIE